MPKKTGYGPKAKVATKKMKSKVKAKKKKR